MPLHRSTSMRCKTQATARLGRLSVLSLALAASFAPLAAQATCSLGGSYTSSISGTQNWGQNDCSISSSGVISGGSPALHATANVGTLTNNGRIAGGETGFKVESTSTVASIVNNGTISADYTYAIRNGSVISALTNNGKIAGGDYGVYNQSGASITSLVNSTTGTIAATSMAVYNFGLISTLDNSGSIVGSDNAVYNSNTGTITSLINSSTGSISGTTAISNSGLISTLDNSGAIFGTVVGVYTGAGATITSLLNSGTISGTTYGIQSDNGSSITSLNNTTGGVITGAAGGIVNAGSIGAVVNSGTIRSSGYAVYNATTGTIGPIINSGMIAGIISNLSTRSMTINGGSGSTFGTLTGSSTGIGSADMGTILSTSGSLIFGSGNLLLNDNIAAGSGTVSNAGATLQVNNRVSITGNYSQAAGASLQIGVADGAIANGIIGSDTGYGRLVVSGNATVDSGSSIVLQKNGNSYAFAAGQRYVVITAGGTGTYNENTLNYSISGISGATLSGANIANNLVVTIQGVQASRSSQATSPNASSALRGLGQYGGISANLLNLYNASLAIGSEADANRVGEQLTPTLHQNSASAASAANFGGIDVVNSHVNGLRVAQAVNGSGVATGENTATWTGWTQVFGGDAHQGMIDAVSGYKASYSGLVLGADRSLGDAWRAGAAFTHSQTSISGADNLSGSSAHVNAYGLIAYAGYAAQPWYLNLSASAVRNNYSATRLVSLTGFSDAASASYNGWQYVAKAEAGYPLALAQNMTVTPLASLSYSRQNLSGYTETGSGSALAVQSSSVNAVRSGLGARLEKNIQTSMGELTPFAQFIWSHQYNDSRMSTSASFAADSTGVTSFTTQSAAPMKNVAELALGLNLLKKDDLTLSARYDLQAARHYDAQTFSVRLQKRF